MGTYYTSDDRRFVRHTWEEVRDFCRSTTIDGQRAALVTYLDTKTLGYDTRGLRQSAFSGKQSCGTKRYSEHRMTDIEVAPAAGLHVLRNESTQPGNWGNTLPFSNATSRPL